MNVFTRFQHYWVYIVCIPGVTHVNYAVFESYGRHLCRQGNIAYLWTLINFAQNV